MGESSKRGKRKHDDTVSEHKSSSLLAICGIQTTPVLVPKDTSQMERNELGIQDNEEELIRHFTDNGIDETTVNLTAEWSELGPRSGLSNARRLQRGIKQILMCNIFFVACALIYYICVRCRSTFTSSITSPQRIATFNQKNNKIDVSRSSSSKKRAYRSCTL